MGSKESLGLATITSNTKSFRHKEKGWVFIHGFQRHVCTEMVLKYLNKKNLENFNFEVIELPTTDTQNKYFRIGANFELKDQLYNYPFVLKDMVSRDSIL